MRSSIPFFWTLLLAIGAALFHSRGLAATQATTPCEALEAWELATGSGYSNSTGNLTDIGYNRTAGGTSGQGSGGGMNRTTSRNASIPMPNGTATLPRSTNSPSQSKSQADHTFPAKTTAATLVVAILLLAA